MTSAPVYSSIRCSNANPIPLQALRAEIAQRRDADATQIGLVGFSAGGHLAEPPGHGGQRAATIRASLSGNARGVNRTARRALLLRRVAKPLQRNTGHLQAGPGQTRASERQVGAANTTMLSE